MREMSKREDIDNTAKIVDGGQWIMDHVYWLVGMALGFGY